MGRKSIGVFILLALGLSFSGCGGCGTGKNDYKYRVAVIPKGLTHEHWQSVERGAERAADDLDEDGIKVKIVWDGPKTENDTGEQINMINRHLGTGVDAFVLAPLHSKTMVEPVRKVSNKKIPVVVIDSDLDDKDVYIKYVATNNYNGGRLAAQHLLESLKKDGKSAPRLGLFRYAQGSESTEQREKGFLDYIDEETAKQKAAGMDTITVNADQPYAEGTIDSAQKNSKPWLTRIGDKVDAIFAPNESSASGLLNELKNSKLNWTNKDSKHRIRLMAFDSSKTLLDAVRNGDIEGTIVQDPYKMGFLGVWLAVKHLEGYDVSGDDKYLGTGEFVLTRDNIDEEQSQQLFDKEKQAKRTIELPNIKKR